MDDSTKPAVPPAKRCCSGFFFFLFDALLATVDVVVASFEFAGTDAASFFLFCVSAAHVSFALVGVGDVDEPMIDAR